MQAETSKWCGNAPIGGERTKFFFSLEVFFPAESVGDNQKFVQDKAEKGGAKD